MKRKGKALRALQGDVYGQDDRILNVEEEVVALRMRNDSLAIELNALRTAFEAHLRNHPPTPPNIYPNPWPNTWPHIISDTSKTQDIQTCVFGTGHLNPDDHRLREDEKVVEIRPRRNPALRNPARWPGSVSPY